MNAIQITGLRKTYGSVNALDGLDLEIPSGSIFGFLGPNGAGKTTTLRIIAGLARPSSGQIEINGTPSVAFKSNRSIGFLPEEPAFYPWMTPAEYLDFSGRLFNLRGNDRKQRTARLLELAGLTEVSKRKIGGFSRGMRQRLGLAQALVNRPRLLLLDEPISALDPLGRREVLAMIETLGKECTVVMSTHILADVERICDTVAIIDKGKRIIQSSREELMRQYASPALELEFNHGYIEKLEEIETSLRSLPAVNKVYRENYVIRLSVADISTSQQEILKLVLENHWQFERLDVEKPTLEEVFVGLIGKEGRKK